MTRTAWIGLLSVLFASVFVQAAAADEAAWFASDASRIVGTYEPKQVGHTPEVMAAAAQAFLDSLDNDQRKQAALPLDHPERRKWTNLPARDDAGGLRLSDCTEPQVHALCDLLATLLSESGYQKMVNIMLADDQLLKGGRRRSGIGTETFAVMVFGTPTPDGPWSFQIDGHHMGVNLALEGSKLTMSPSFIGTQPEAYHQADERVRPLAGEVDSAYRLVSSLTDEQRARAIVGKRRGRLQTGPGTDGQTPKPVGLPCVELTAELQEMLLKLVAQWVNNLPPAHAADRMKQLQGEVDQMHFAWRGPTTPAGDISYTIQGPTLIIEYACQDLGGNPPDHLHTMYRDPTNEYGGQLGE